MDDYIVDTFEKNILKYLPEVVSKMKVQNVPECVRATIDFTLSNSGLSEEELQKMMFMSFSQWWGMMLTKCSY